MDLIYFHLVHVLLSDLSCYLIHRPGTVYQPVFRYVYLGTCESCISIKG